ncbi:MAG: hypothetical protein RL088_2509 [Verrucomicrobiota bacterium]|jgi:hypothetical protein
MKFTAIILACIFAFAAEAADKKPAAKKPAAKPAKPQKSIGELALDEAKAADENKDGKITGTEVTALRSAFSKNPKSWLYIYDANGNRLLDDGEIAGIKWGPALAPSKPAPSKPVKPAPAKAAPKKKK